MAAVLVVVGYLAGSLPTGVLVARLRGVDIRAVGSGNMGATNIARNLGKKLGLLVLLVDALKGFVPVLVARRLLAGDAYASIEVAAVGLAAVLGHVFPVWLRFRGGKGVATAAGVFLALSPVALAVAFALYAGLYAALRISSVGSLAAATALPVTLLVLRAPRGHVGLAALLWLVIVVKHRDNIRRLLRREEGKV